MDVPFLRPSVPAPEAWTPYLETAYRRQYFTNFGSLHDALCDRLRAKYAYPGYGVMLATNATVALQSVLRAQGAQRTCVLPSFTFPATLHSVIAANLDPLLCDADPNRWDMSCSHLAELMEKYDIDSVVGLRPYGFQRDLSDLFELCRARSIPVAIDAAAVLGDSRQKGTIGSAYGQIEVCSLHATKVFAIGEGAAIFAPNEAIDRIRRGLNFGFQTDGGFVDGGNGKLDEIRAAMGLAMLDNMDDEVSRRIKIADLYFNVFRDAGSLVALPIDVGPTPWQTFPVRFATKEARDRFESALAERGIESRDYYSPSLRQGYNGRFKTAVEREETPIADSLAQQMLCLPIYGSMAAEQIQYVVESVGAIIHDAKSRP